MPETTPTRAETAKTSDLSALATRHRSYFLSGATRSMEWRESQLLVPEFQEIELPSACLPLLPAKPSSQPELHSPALPFNWNPAPLFSGVLRSRRRVQSEVWTVKKAGSVVRDLWHSEIARPSFSRRIIALSAPVRRRAAQPY
jgi:hypothetical protein